MKMYKTVMAFFLAGALLAGCGETPAPGIGETGSLEGVWRRTGMVVRRSAGPEQPVVQPPFTVLGALLTLDEEDLMLVEQVGDQYSLTGETTGWTCDLAGAYAAPIELVFTAADAGEIRWTAEAQAAALAEGMAEPWRNTCVYQGEGGEIPTTLEDHAPLVSVPTLALVFQLLDDGQTLALTARFETPGQGGNPTVTVERAYLYTRVR